MQGADVSDLSLESEYQAEPVVPGNASRPITLTVHSSGAKLLHMKSTASVLGSLGDEDQDPQAELSTTLAELVLLGTQMTLVLAFVRGLVHLYTLHTDGSSDVLATLQAFWRKHRGAREWLESSGETLKQGATATRRPSITSCHHL